ncbi:MAG: trypsin-like peptidase domain-containing protein [Fuerstiella sp.]|nr:trypsin-like peptidase domain-containing protein [Fuerstiella sp.]
MNSLMNTGMHQTDRQICLAVLIGALSVPLAGSAAVGASDVLPGWQQREQHRIEVLTRISPGVVCVMPPDAQGGGSGVLISADGYAVTNYHVIADGGSFFKCGLNDGQVYDAVIVGIDPTGDVAMIRLLGRSDFPFATAGNSDEVQVGDEVMALGNPFLLADDFSPTVTFGIASGIHRYQYPANTYLEYTDCIQIDASINPGNSGGPLFDIQGRWIGINGRASFEQRGRVNVGAAYAISVRQVQLFIDHLKSGRIVDHGTSEFAVETDISGRVLVSDVIEISEAWRRGLRPGDELVSFAGRALTSANDFKNILGIFPAENRVPLTFRNRDGLQKTSLRLRPLHEFQQAPPLPQKNAKPNPQRPKAPDEPDAARKTEPMQPPAEFAHLFEARDGFANYAFNRQHQTRLLAPIQQELESCPHLSRTWQLSISADGSNELMPLVVAEQGAGLTQDKLPWHQDADNLTPDAEPHDFPGLLTVAVQWHRLFRDPVGSWSEIFYAGAEQHYETGQHVDVLQTMEGTVSCRWLFAQGSPLPYGVDVNSGAGQDESRVLFEGWNMHGEIPAPTRIGVIVCQTGEIAWLHVHSAEIRK